MVPSICRRGEMPRLTGARQWASSALGQCFIPAGTQAPSCTSIPKEQLTAVFMSRAPSPIRAYYRKLIKQQAIVD